MPISVLQIEKKMPVPDHEYPLHKYVKEIYAKRIKRAHNTANNPQYPKEIVKEPFKDRVQFTIIGHRFTEAFIQTVRVAQGLYKYRSKKFDAPLIRGVTGVEWPKVWNDYKIQYGDIVPCIQNPVIVLINGKLLGGTEEFNEYVDTKYNYRLKLDLPRLCVDEFVQFVKNSGLYADLVPLTCENFLRLCNDKKGGYSGTPVHRIVKDCWIQCGGFGLKSTDLDCENFIVPHDRRGVLCMANDGRHIDCSTQFFVLLQPASWMAQKYVAFGQLIDGDEILKMIESVPTWYESPTRNIIITDSGILNLNCQDIDINKGTIEYLEKHVEDLIALGDWLIEIVMEKFFLELEFQHIAKLEAKGEDAGEHQDEQAGVHTTARFIRKKEDFHRDTEVSKNESSKDENNDFDVESYTYEAEEERYSHVSLPETPSVVVKPMKPYYLAFTDVPYPGEIDSTHDLKKFLKGHYCVESDLLKSVPKKQQKYSKSMHISYSSALDVSSQMLPSVESLDSADEREIKRYLKYNVDRVSFAGGVVRNIAKGIANTNFYEGIRKSEMMTEEDVRILRQRLACIGGPRPSEIGTGLDSKKVSIAAPEEEEVQKIKRRQTGFMRQFDLERFRYIHQSNSSSDDNDIDNVSVKSDGTISQTRKVRIDPSTAVSDSDHPLRRPTGYAKSAKAQASDSEIRQSVLTRLYDDVTTSTHELGPTLKNYKTFAESHKKNMFLTISPTARIKNTTNDDRNFRRTSIIEDDSFDEIMNVQHGKKFARKISSDYVTTIDQYERKINTNTTLRSVEYAKTRPMLSVAEYQRRKQLFKEKSNEGRDDEIF